MSGFYFSSVPKLKIRRGGVVDDIPHPPPVPYAASVPGVTILQTPETMVGSFSFISPTSGVTSGVSSASFPAGLVPSSKNSKQSGKRKLDPTVLGKLSAPAAIAAASVHKYGTSAFGKAVDNVELTELLKLAEMYISQSHVLNCELYKVLAMNVDKLRSTVGRDEDVNALRSENKDLRESLAFSKDARARAIYDITKAKRIQGVCVQAQKKAESQLRSCQSMVHAKDKELTEALTELSKA
ncbi:hypothetical protein Fot_23975 [Forsythia ovata]|uniref:Uncharacterized protein n=1 Tax=Forsythia ovata TaxID=205694 RepID=A0ABD1U4Z6_9LAMI